MIRAGSLQPALDAVGETCAIPNQNGDDDCRRLRVVGAMTRDGVANLPAHGCRRFVPPAPSFDRDDRRALDRAGQIEWPAHCLQNRIGTAGIQQELRLAQCDRGTNRAAGGPFADLRHREIAADVRLDSTRHTPRSIVVLNVMHVDQQPHAEIGCGGIGRQTSTNQYRIRCADLAGRRGVEPLDERCRDDLLARASTVADSGRDNGRADERATDGR